MYKKFKTKISRFFIKKRLIRRYSKLIEVDKLMEGHIIQQTLLGGNAEFLSRNRKDLIRTQQTIKQQQGFVDYLNSL